MLNGPLVIEVTVPNQESEQTCICVQEELILPLFTILIFDFCIVLSVGFLLLFFFCRKISADYLMKFLLKVMPVILDGGLGFTNNFDIGPTKGHFMISSNFCTADFNMIFFLSQNMHMVICINWLKEMIC